MSTAAKAIRRCCDEVLKMIAVAITYAGDILQLEDGRAAVKIGLDTTAIGDPMSVETEGIYDIVSASATTFSRGDEVWWDLSALQAVPASGTLDTGDIYLGVADADKVSGDLFVRTILNKKVALRPIVHEFATTTDLTSHTLVPANMNSNGFVVELVYAVVTEVFAGATEDQGIVTVKDGDGNTICTLTPTNAGADAVGDVILGTSKLLGGATGDAIKTVAAGKSITAITTQATSGAGAAGKMKVYLKLTPLN